MVPAGILKPPRLTALSDTRLVIVAGGWCLGWSKAGIRYYSSFEKKARAWALFYKCVIQSASYSKDILVCKSLCLKAEFLSSRK